jgi:hypothetical protein
MGRVALALAVFSLASLAAVLIAQSLSDGPLNAIIPGGPLRTGPLVTEAHVDWPAVLGDRGSCSNDGCAPMEPVELQLVDPPRSRYVGIMVRDGQLYVPCDLGFMWGRFSGRNRRVLHLIYLFKRWHEDALHDGRVVLRIDGKRYERQAVRVTDPELEAALRAQLEEMARHWVAPEPLADAPAEEPNDIWFFRIEPRPAA